MTDAQCIALMIQQSKELPYPSFTDEHLYKALARARRILDAANAAAHVYAGDPLNHELLLECMRSPSPDHS